MARTTQALLTRCEIKDATGRMVSTQFSFPIHRGGRSTSATIAAEHVPAFEGHAAWFEIERVTPPGGGRHWRVVRLIEGREIPRRHTVWGFG